MNARIDAANGVRQVERDVTKLSSWILLGGFFFVTATARAVYSSQGQGPSDRFAFLEAIGLLSLLWYWFSQQCAPHRPSFPLDIEIFVGALWFLLLPFYLWRFERWRGCLKLVLLAAMYLFAYASSVALHYMLVA